MGKGACSRERRAAKLNLDAPQGANLNRVTHHFIGRKDFLPVEPQSGLSFLFRLGAPRFA